MIFWGDTVDGSEIPFPTTWDVQNPCKSWDIRAGFLPSTVGLGEDFDSDMFCLLILTRKGSGFNVLNCML